MELKKIIQEVLDTMSTGKDLDQALDYLYVKCKISGADEFLTEEQIEDRDREEIEELESQLEDSISKDDLIEFDKFFNLKNRTFINLLERYLLEKTDILVSKQECTELESGINEYGVFYKLTLKHKEINVKNTIIIYQTALLDLLKETGRYSLFVFEQ